ncbi:transcription factor subunit Med10 [Diplocarpon rosae]|nr:transcription factor subunit Med10 [Diplocarpon rosae]
MAPVSPADHDVVERQIKDVIQDLFQIMVQYVDNGRNPDIYTREFVELVRKGNQLMKGKMDAYASFRDVLAQEIGHAMPEVRDDVVKALLATGGDPHVLEKREGST